MHKTKSIYWRLGIIWSFTSSLSWLLSSSTPCHCRSGHDQTHLLMRPGDGTRVPSAMAWAPELLCVLWHSTQSWCMLFPSQCLYDFSSNRTVAVCYSLTVYLILLLTHHRKSQNAHGCRLVFSMSKIPEEILTKPKQSCASSASDPSSNSYWTQKVSQAFISFLISATEQVSSFPDLHWFYIIWPLISATN